MNRIINSNHIRKIFMDISKYSYKRTKKQSQDQLSNKVESVVSRNLDSNSQIIKKKAKVAKKGKVEYNPLQTLNIIKKWREVNEAPVDVVGCEKLFDRTESEDIRKYQLLVSIFLSVQTKDETTAKVVEKLIKYGLTPQKILQTTQDDLLELIREVNFNKKKSKNLLIITKQIVEMGGIPKTLQGVTSLPGIGLKIANIYLKTAQGLVTGIGVDTHVHRISNRLGWVNTANPNETQNKLQQVFEHEHWGDINVCLVGFGQTICDAKKPKCSECCVGKRCPSYHPLF